jgi:hypothetical protein
MRISHRHVANPLRQVPLPALLVINFGRSHLLRLLPFQTLCGLQRDILGRVDVSSACPQTRHSVVLRSSPRLRVLRAMVNLALRSLCGPVLYLEHTHPFESTLLHLLQKRPIVQMVLF